jgi:predicted nucleic acid-binding protein
MKIYFDVCCLCRPYDDFSQARVYIESEAVLAIMKLCKSADWSFATSEVIDTELLQMRDRKKLANVIALCQQASDFLSVTEESRNLAKEFRKKKLKFFDSEHLAVAEVNGYDVLLTTDDNFLKAAQKLHLKTMVKNPAKWILGGLGNE